MKHHWFVDIIEKSTRQTVKTLGPFHSERAAEDAERGVLINVNFAEFFTSVRSQP